MNSSLRTALRERRTLANPMGQVLLLGILGLAGGLRGGFAFATAATVCGAVLAAIVQQTLP
jgi:hypothetical protein